MYSLQSLCHFLEHELSAYHALLAELELQMGNEISQLPPLTSNGLESATINSGAFGSGGGTSSIFENEVESRDSEMTFQRLRLWSEEALLRLRVMSTLVEAAQREWLIVYPSRIPRHVNGNAQGSRNFCTLLL